MARTAPVPDIPPIPGMCPSIAGLAGGGAGGSGSGGGAGDGSGDNNAGGSGSGEGAEGDPRGAPDYAKSPSAATPPTRSTWSPAGRSPTQTWSFSLPGPLPLSFRRMYSSKAAARDMGLGYGWAHSFGWEEWSSEADTFVAQTADLDTARLGRPGPRGDHPRALGAHHGEEGTREEARVARAPAGDTGVGRPKTAVDASRRAVPVGNFKPFAGRFGRCR